MVLVVFDFDHTIIDANSDIEVNKLFPSDDERVRVEKDLGQFRCWTDRMQQVFRQLQAHRVTRNDYAKCMQKIPLTSGFHNLIEYLSSQPDTHLIVASDSNQFFIETILTYHRLDHAFERIITNPAHFNEHEQYLLIEQYGQQTCPTCPSNMCKREILDKYRSSPPFNNQTRVIFIGDGHNDVCPANGLHEGDLVCARSGYRMAKDLKKQQEVDKKEFSATYFEWNDGMQIKEYLKEKWFKTV